MAVSHPQSGTFGLQKWPFRTSKVALSYTKTATFEMFSGAVFVSFRKKTGGKRSTEPENRDGKCGFWSPFCHFWYAKCRFWYNKFLRFSRMEGTFFIYIPMAGIAAGCSGEAESRNSRSRNRVYKKTASAGEKNRRISENRYAQRCYNM